ncbi:hypothetical protein PIROE2DRAFT_9337 [Piromyces sp. E2]|nr:hypothetical protein PIROE2DRAFT_9337 [Piromyces sp. E2]|eukprot:OUM64030.1 hypothetical protein PIROE2DRAFT_9337 [Piromyces sp. E2]
MASSFQRPNTSTAKKFYEQEADKMTEMFSNFSLKDKEKKTMDRPAVDTRKLSPTQYDLDHDVVPEPGFFSDDTPKLIYSLNCAKILNTHPNSELPEDTKNNVVSATMFELLMRLKGAFNNIGSVKLAKIKLISLRQNYGNLNFDEEPLALLFYIGLNPKYQEVQKLETFRENLEKIITSWTFLKLSAKKTDKLPPYRPVDCKIILQKDATLHYGPIYPISEE